MCGTFVVSHPIHIAWVSRVFGKGFFYFQRNSTRRILTVMQTSCHHEPAIVWFRNDLRLHDNEVLWKANLEADGFILPVYIYETGQFGTMRYQFPKTGIFRTKFLIESVECLKRGLRDLGSDLFVFAGEAETIIPQIAQQVGARGIYFQGEDTCEELRTENSVVEKLLYYCPNILIHKFYGQTLVHREDIPMNLSKVPDVFTVFRKQLESNWKIRSTWPTPQMRKFYYSSSAADNDKLDNFLKAHCASSNDAPKPSYSLCGGETFALDRLDYYFWRSDNVSRYKDTRNGLLGSDYSSRFSPYLSLGCLSPRKVYYELKRYESDRICNLSTYWLVFEMLWRDYFRFIAIKYGNNIFKLEGIKNVSNKQWTQNSEWTSRWIDGTTGIPFVDANMRELKETGWLSNRGRQNVASFLVNDLQLDWRIGAEWFETCLIDYDPCSNYGNWNYIAGIGTDPRNNRYFNVIKQSKTYDKEGEYIRRWLPELSQLPTECIHEPYKMSKDDQAQHGIEIGKDYPYPCITKLGKCTLRHTDI